MARSGNPSKTVQELLDHPYVKRALEDPEVRDNAKTAYEAAQAAYERLKKESNLASAVFDDKKLHRELKATGKSIATAREHLIDKPRKRRRGRFLLLTAVGAALAIALSEGLRNKLLDALFGAEEEFDYVSTTAPPPAPAAAAAAPEPEAPAAASKKSGGSKNASKEAAEDAEAAATSSD